MTQPGDYVPPASVLMLADWRGTWSAVVEYTIGDGALYGGSAWLCTRAHGPSQTPATDSGFWTLIASKGSDSTVEGPAGATGAQGPPGIQGPVGPDDQVASEVPFTPTGLIGSTNVQAALAEVASEAAFLTVANTFTQAQTIAGGTTALDRLNLGADVNLYRSVANVLKTDDALDVALDANIRGDLWVRPDAVVLNMGQLGPGGTYGINIQDTNLYRSAANVLSTDDKFIVEGTANGERMVLESSASSAWVSFRQGSAPDASWKIGTSTDNAGVNEFGIRDDGLGLTRLLFDVDGKLWINPGAGADTNLYRSAANVLKTDDALEVVGALTNGGTAVSLAGHTHTESVVLDFSKAGALTVVAGTHRLYAPGGVTWTIAEVRASVGTAPTGAALIVDVHKSGTTVFTTQSNRPEVAISGFTDLSGSIEVNSLASGEYLTVDVDQIGSTIAGSDLTVQVYLTRAQ